MQNLGPPAPWSIELPVGQGHQNEVANGGLVEALGIASNLGKSGL